MMRHISLLAIVAALTLLVGGLVWAQSAPAAPPADSANHHKPKLAVTVSAQEPGGQNVENLEDLLMIELANQPFLQLVDRRTLQTVIKEHAIAMTNLNETKNALTLGKFAGADYLLHVLTEKKANKTTATIRLVEVATGQVKLESQVALAYELALSAAAIREKVLAALRPDSQAVNRLTVGIAAFPNHSGTDRSDKLGIELQKALRRRLNDRAWAVVLERQYPAALLEEVDLKRSGLVRGNTAETLPPADLVILGNMEDADHDYETNKPWAVKLDLTLRLRGHSKQISRAFRSDAVEAAADAIAKQIDEFRREQPASRAGVAEKELWRRQALYLTPPRCVTWAEALVPNFSSSSKQQQLEAIRAWENVLLLDADEPEAMTYLGICLIGFNRWSMRDKPTVAQMIAGSHLVERALRSHPNRVRSDTFIMCIDPLIVAAPARAKEMAQYVVDHPEQFRSIAADVYFVKHALLMPTSEGKGDVEALQATWNRVIASCEEDPESVLLAFSQSPVGPNGTLDQFCAFLAKHLESSDPVVQFVAHKNIGEQLCRKRDKAGLKHLGKAIDLLDEVYPRCSRYPYKLSDVYRLRIEACQSLGRPEEAKETALSGTRHCIKAGRFDNSVAWLYHYCVTRALGAGQEKEAIAVCDAYLADVKMARSSASRPDSLPQIHAKRQELLARLAGTPVPDMSGWQLVKGTEAIQPRLPMLRMAAAGQQLWLVVGARTGGSALAYSPDGDKTRELPNVPGPVYSVAATKDAVFFATMTGLYKLAFSGDLLKHYRQEDGSLPGNYIQDVCEGGGKIYMSGQGGIAMLDPATNKVSVLAPSNRDAKQGVKSPGGVQRVRWDAATPRLYACSYPLWYFTFPTLSREFGWSPKEKVWELYPIEQSPLFVASQGDEALIVRLSGDRSQFHFVKAGKEVTTAVPVSQSMGEPAWDEHHIWVPTSSGLYEVGRSTGRVGWLAYLEGNLFLSALKAGNRLYVATSRGLYWCDISSMPTAMSVPVEMPAVAMSAARKGAAAGAAPIAFTVDLLLEDDAKAKVTLKLDDRDTLLTTKPGKVRIDLPAGSGGVHYIYFHCPGYASQHAYLEIGNGRAKPKQAKVTLFRKRYVVLHCSFNTTGQRNLEGDGVEKQHLALPHWTGPKYFREDWRVWQKSNGIPTFGDTPYLEFHRYAADFGFQKPPAGTSYEQMKEAPQSGYQCENIKVVKGLVLYCRVNGNSKEGIGYGKIVVEAVTEKPPDDVQTLEAP